MRHARLMNRLSLRAETLHRSIPKPSDGKPWYRIKNLSNGVGNAEVYIYDEIGLWGVTAAEFVRELQYLEAVHIDLRINSPGGDVWDGVAIYNALCNHPASVTTYIDGLAASAASFIAQAGGHVFIARNGTMMIHDAEGICIGNAADMIEMAELLDRTSDNIADIYAQRCSTVGVWRKAMRNVSWYVGKEAVDGGLADDTYEPEQGTGDQPAERRRRANARSGGPGNGWTTHKVGQEGDTWLPPERVNNRVPRPISTACPEHSTDTVEGDAWDESAQVGNLAEPLTITTARRVYGWYDGSRVEDGALPGDACKLAHHVVDSEGMPGAAHLDAVRAALDNLADSGIPESEQDACRDHLQGHLDDAEQGGDDVPADTAGAGVSDSVVNTADDDIETWWNPELFKTAVATAADQHQLYGFDADSFREIMRAAATENFPAPAEPKAVVPEPLEPVRVTTNRQFVEALRRGLL